MYEWVMSYVWMGHATHVMRQVPRVNESCRIWDVQPYLCVCACVMCATISVCVCVRDVCNHICVCVRVWCEQPYLWPYLCVCACVMCATISVCVCLCDVCNHICDHICVCVRVWCVQPDLCVCACVMCATISVCVCVCDVHNRICAFTYWYQLCSHFIHVNESCHTYEWVVSHTWMRHVSYAIRNDICVCALIDTSFAVISQRLTCHVTHVNESCHTRD